MVKRGEGGAWPLGGEPPRGRRILIFLDTEVGDYGPAKGWHSAECDRPAGSREDRALFDIGLPGGGAHVMGDRVLAWAELPPDPA